jgi:hypothetical protein
MLTRCFPLCLLLAVSLSGVGCGSGVSSIDGKVTKGGQPYSPAADGDLTILLSGENGNYVGKVEEGGSFKIESKEGIKPGKYSVRINRYPSKSEIEKMKTPPVPKEQDTGEAWDVSSSNTSFTLDISKGKK